jgi:hypothetical protein
MHTCHGVKTHATRTVRDGNREWSIPTFSFYVGRKYGRLHTTTNHCLAAPMTADLAECLAAKLNSQGMQAEACELFADPETVIHDSLVDIGEEAPPPAQPPGSIAEFVNAIERCFQERLSSLEILNLCNKAVLGLAAPASGRKLTRRH